MTAPPNVARLSGPLARFLRVPPAELDACLVTAVEADLPDVERLRREVFGAEITWDDRAYLRWRYRLDRPARRVNETAPGTTHLWLFRRGAELLGCLGAEHLTLATPWGTHDALRFLDLMSATRLRGMGIGAWLNLKLLEQVEVGISVGGSDQSIGMIGRLFQRLPDRRVWAMPLRSGPLIAARWPELAKVPLVPAASRVADHLLSLARRVAARVSGPTLQVTETTSLATDVDDVEALSRSMVRAGYTLAPRTAAQWRWRYLENPRRKYTIHAARHDGRVVAMLVSREGAEVGELVDWLWDAERPEPVLLAAFTAVIEGFARRGATKARAMAYDPVSESVCRRLGMRVRPTRAPYAIRARGAALEAQLAGARWFLTLGDSDGD